MRKLLESISIKTKLTKTEVKTFSFICVVFLIGLFTKSVNINLNTDNEQKFEYSYHDSLFKAIQAKKNNDVFLIKNEEKRVDSEVKLSDFSKLKLVSKKDSYLQVKEHSININTANVDQLIKLPGIGPKTAEKIIAFRNERKELKNLNELLKVNGIGSKKLNRIKQFLYIEK